MNFMPAGNAWLLIQFGGKDKAEADANACTCMDEVNRRGNAPPMKLFDNSAQESWSGISGKRVWVLRPKSLTCRKTTKAGRTLRCRDKLGGYLRDLKKLMDKYNYVGPLYGHL